MLLFNVISPLVAYLVLGILATEVNSTSSTFFHSFEVVYAIAFSFFALILLTNCITCIGKCVFHECGRITILSIYLLLAIIQFGLVLKAVGQIDSQITSYKEEMEFYKDDKEYYKKKLSKI